MTGEQSPTGSHLSHVLSKTRYRKKNDSSTNSVVSDEEHRGVRASIEGAIEKLKHHDDDSKEDDTHTLDKLLTKAIKSKRRRKRQQEADELLLNEEAARGRSIAERGTLWTDSASQSTVEGDESSLITLESETES
jgi:hypothetical protein